MQISGSLHDLKMINSRTKCYTVNSIMLSNLLIYNKAILTLRSVEDFQKALFTELGPTYLK